MPPVSVEGIENGDWVVITGELKQAGQHTSLNDFWATSIEKSATQIVGGTPGSCGYVWDAERGGWHRPWVPDSFIPAEDKPEWDEFIASPVVASDILVDGSYAGKEVEIVAGGSLTVTLESNPTTGFQWELAGISDEAVLELVDQEFVAPETALVGAGGKELWTFKALNEGVSEISMEYRRPWEQDVQPAETFILTVVVK
jgi:inhibitor of cysteine peptidase